MSKFVKKSRTKKFFINKNVNKKKDINNPVDITKITTNISVYKTNMS